MTMTGKRKHVFGVIPDIPDEVYGDSWNGKLEPASKNALYDKIQTLAPKTDYLRTDTGTSVAIVASDIGGYVVCAAATAVTVTLPADLPLGSSVTVVQVGAKVSFVAGGVSGISVPSDSLASIKGQFHAVKATVTVDFYGTELWTLEGALTPVSSLVTTKTADYTIAATDGVILGDATSGSITLTLPTAVGATRSYTIKRISTNTNSVTVEGNGTETIDDALNYALLAYESITVVSDNDEWFII